MAHDDLYREAEKRIERARRDRITHLDLSNLNLTTLPEAIGNLTNLQYLVLTNNQLTAIPEAIGKLTNLQSLRLDNNQLTAIPEAIGNLTNLQYLVLTNNQLKAIPEAIGKLTNLQRLDLDNNQLTAIPEAIGKLTNLHKLLLTNNQLKAIPETIGNFTNLQTLLLDNNQLTAIPEAIENLTNLQTLRLDKNQLTAIPEAIGNLTKLQELHLDNNRLAAIPEAIGNLTNLEVLFLHDNPALNLPPEILGPTSLESDKNAPLAAPKSILGYYFRPKKPLNEAKLILVGFGKVGKTSLVNRLVEGTFSKDEKKTDGIKITQWPVTLSNGSDEVQLHVWDFGGQEIMHSTHQFSLSHRSLYLLVLSGRQGHEDADAEYWLNLIRSFGGDSQVIVVLNKQREHPFDLNRQNLHSKFPGMIQDFIKTECEDEPEGIDDLKQSILRETGQLPGLRDGFPEEWFAIKDKLSTMEDDYLTFEKYREICSALGENTQLDQDRLAGYLHQLGVALNFKDDPRLGDMHVLNPRWVTEGIYTILNARELEARKGELHINDLAEILHPVKYPRERHAFLLNLMRKFNLCFEFPDQEGHFLVPDLADKNQAKEADEFDATECLNFRYGYPALHEGVLPSFITRTYILSEKQPRWRTGVILAFEGSRALVKADLTGRTVSIYVSGPSPEARRRLLAVVRTSFEQIHRYFDFKPNELVPVPGHPDVAIPYSELLVLERTNIETKQQVIGEEVLNLNVLDLLNGVDLEGARQTRAVERESKNVGVKLFYSYSHKDEALREELETHLKILQRQGLIDEWHDRRIVAGQEWAPEIDKHLEEADVILLLVSADFIASNYCYEIEMQRAMERHEAKEARVIPIILRENNWTGAPFGKLQALPKDGKPVKLYSDKDAAWKEISVALERVAKAHKPSP